MLFQVALRALHIDVLPGHKLRADQVISCGTSFDVVATGRFKSSFQILADWTIHALNPFQPSNSRMADVVPSSLLLEDFLLGADPVLFVLAGFTTTAFIQLIGPLSYCVLGWDGVWHHPHVARRAFRDDDNCWLRFRVNL